VKKREKKSKIVLQVLRIKFNQQFYFSILIKKR
jgi:hypothetical protein